MGTLSVLKKLLLLVDRQEVNIVHRSYRFGVAYTIHWVLGNHIIHQRGSEHCAHCDVCLPDCSSGVLCFHPI